MVLDNGVFLQCSCHFKKKIHPNECVKGVHNLNERTNKAKKTKQTKQ